MKKQWIALLTGCVLVCSVLVGYGLKLPISVWAATGNEKGCTDEAILSQLKNDGTPEFVLDDDYTAITLASDNIFEYKDYQPQVYCIANQLLNEDGTVSTAIELEEGDQAKVWGYASQYLELQEGLKIVVVQPGIIERNGELVILDKNLKADYPSETEIASEDNVIPGSYTVPDGWTKSEKHSTDSQIFYIEEGHENDEKPDNISIHVGKNNYSLEEHEQFRDAIVQQMLMQLDGIEAQLNGDGTYTRQGDLLYIFTIDEGDIVTTQYYIVKDYGFCLVQLTNFSGSEITEQAAREMVDSFVWR